MSVLLAVAQAVAATPVPTPSPVMIEKVTQVYQTPQAVVQLFQLGGVAVAGGLTSLLHFLALKGKLSANANRLLVTAYSSLAGVAYLFLTGHFGLTSQDLEVGATVLLAFLGSNQGSHMLSEAIRDVYQNRTSTDASGAAVPLATDSVPPEAGV